MSGAAGSSRARTSPSSCSGWSGSPRRSSKSSGWPAEGLRSARAAVLALPQAELRYLRDEVVRDRLGQRELQRALRCPVRPEAALGGLVAGRCRVEADVALP